MTGALLALSSAQATVDEQTVVVEAGDDRLGAEVLGRVGEGDFFGEIALLRDVPRTATVRALADSELYVLGRNDFLAAVLAHSGVRAAGEAVAEERLAAVGSVQEPPPMRPGGFEPPTSRSGGERSIP